MQTIVVLYCFSINIKAKLLNINFKLSLLSKNQHSSKYLINHQKFKQYLPQKRYKRQSDRQTDGLIKRKKQQTAFGQVKVK